MTTRMIFLLCLATSGVSVRCTEDVPDCPNQLCVLSGLWQLTTVYYDDEEVSDDFSRFRLELTEPQPATNEISTYSRIQVSGEPDSGSWSVENGGSILRLVPGNFTSLSEDWVIERFSPRELVLVINRDTGIKEGPATIRLVLEPVK